MNKSIFAYIAAALGFVATQGARAITGAYTLAAEDNGRTITYTGAGHTISVPKDLPAGFTCKIVQGGAGAATIAAVALSGVTVASGDNFVKTKAAGAVLEVVQSAANKYSLVGAGAVA